MILAGEVGGGETIIVAFERAPQGLRSLAEASVADLGRAVPARVATNSRAALLGSADRVAAEL